MSKKLGTVYVRSSMSSNGIFESHTEGEVILDIRRPAPLGNPHKLPAGIYAKDEKAIHKAHQKAVEDFRKSFERVSPEARQQIKLAAFAVAEGKRVHLICSCWPKPCHGIVIKEDILKLAAKLSAL